jgi:ribose 5-phosphate isomerase RpiB
METMGMAAQEITKNDASVMIVTESQGCGKYFCASKIPAARATGQNEEFFNEIKELSRRAG